MLTSRRNCSSGSAVHGLAAGVGADVGRGADAPMLPAPSASSIAALRSQKRPPNIGLAPLTRAPLAENRLGPGEQVGAVVEGFDIFAGHRPCEAAFVGVGQGDADVALRHFGVDGDAL